MSIVLSSKFEEQIDVAFRLDRQSRQIQRSKAEVASAVYDFSGRVIDIGDNTRTASHVSTFRAWIALFIVLLIERCIKEREIREKSLRRNLACELEQDRSSDLSGL